MIFSFELLFDKIPVLHATPSAQKTARCFTATT